MCLVDFNFDRSQDQVIRPWHRAVYDTVFAQSGKFFIRTLVKILRMPYM